MSTHTHIQSWGRGTGLNGQQDADCGAVGPQAIIKISVDLYAVANPTEKNVSKGLPFLPLADLHSLATPAYFRRLEPSV